MANVVKWQESQLVKIGEEYASNIPTIPKNYDVVNACKTLYFQCKDKGYLDKATPESVGIAVRDMISKGLNPCKNQCYPILYGNKLVVMASYMGNKRMAYTMNNDVVPNSIRSQVIYKGDTFEDKIELDGRRTIVKHEQAPFNERSDEIIGAYAVVQLKTEDGEILQDAEVMTMNQIKMAWSMSKNGGGTAQKFPDMMAKKSVINRLAKRLYSDTDESYNDYDVEDDEPIENEKELDIQYDIPLDETKEEIKNEPKEEVVDIPVDDDTQESMDNEFGDTLFDHMED